MMLLDSAESLEKSYFSSTAPSLLIIGASLSIGNYLLPRLLANFWQSQGITVGDANPPLQIIVSSTADVTNKVANFEVDFGLIEGACHRPDVAVTPWLLDELVFVSSPNHPIILERDRKLITLEQLAKANWLLRERGSGTREALEQALLPHLPQLKCGLEFNDHEAIKQSAAQGLGIACLSNFIVADMLETGRLVELNTEFGRLKRRFSLLIHHQKQMTPGMQNFVNYAMNSEKIINKQVV